MFRLIQQIMPSMKMASNSSKPIAIALARAGVQLDGFKERLQLELMSRVDQYGLGFEPDLLVVDESDLAVSGITWCLCKSQGVHALCVHASEPDMRLGTVSKPNDPRAVATHSSGPRGDSASLQDACNGACGIFDLFLRHDASQFGQVRPPTCCVTEIRDPTPATGDPLPS